MNELMSFSDAKVGDTLQIDKILLTGQMRRRLMDLGFIPGAIAFVVQKSPLGDPTAFHVNNTTIALRKEESCQILCQLIGEKNEKTN